MNRADYSATQILPVLRKLLKLAEDKKDSMRVALAHVNIGKSYANRENFLVAIDCYFKALPWAEAHKDTSLLLDLNNSMGIAYSNRRQHKKAASYFLKNLKIARALKNEMSAAVAANNLAIEYIELKDFKNAEQYLRICYNTLLKFKQFEYLSTVVMNLGEVRFERSQYDSALYYYRWARDIDKKNENKLITDNTSNNLGQLFFKLQQYDSALYYLKYTLQHIDTLNAKYTVKDTYQHLSEVYHAIGDDKKAYYYLKKYKQVNDIIFNDESIKKTTEDETNFAYLKVESKLKLSQQQRAFDKHRTNIFFLMGSIAGFLLLLALLVVFYRFREKKKANMVLTLQKNKIEHQQQEITDSINYAKRIQESILPSHEVLQRHLGEHVLFYKPKDIVGGDFYFVESAHNKKYFAVIDCTGHGVPGGFMSLLGYNAINNALLDLKIEEPAKILDSISSYLVEHFTQEGRQTLRDGMDMSLCCLYEKNGQHILEYAGANNPCWIIRNETMDVVEIKANKQPIGYYEGSKPFTNQILELNKGDMVYLFSDGYADQFGGPFGKKFKYSQMKTVLQQFAPTAIEKQNLIRTAFENWKGNLEQIDDVCILGVRI